MRVFVGVELPDTTKREVAAAVDAVRAGIRRAAPRAEIRWVDPANLHVTLWFIGEIPEPRVAEVSAALSPSYEAGAFGLQFAGVGTFPPAGAPRVIWIGVAAGGEELGRLYGAVRDRLVPLGFEPERRAYSAHLTVARVKDVRRSDVAAVRKVLDRAAVAFGKCDISAVTLFRSRLSPRGAQYEPLLRVPL